MLHLPNMAELVRDEILGRRGGWFAQDDRPPGGVAVEASEPRESEEPWPDEDPDVLDAHRLWVEVESVEPSLCPREEEVRSLTQA